MKISEMSFAQASAVMLRIAAPVANLCDDENLMKAAEDGETLTWLLVQCLQRHNEEVYEIATALIGKTKPEIDGMKFSDLYDELLASYDGVLAGFFSRSKRSAKKDAEES